jgi:prepilin-type N-terminal cleavage/methylation domain-containing protein
MKKGFTLIEMLITISIIGVISMVSINGYLDYRRSVLLDLTTDNVVSQIEQLKSKTRFGDIGSAKFDEINLRLSGEETSSVLDELKCFGFYFKQMGITDRFKIVGFTLPFNNVKKFDVVKNNWSYEGCGKFVDRNEFDFNMENDVYVSADEISLENLIVNFLPPNGDVLSSVDGGLKYSEKDFSFLLKYGEGDFRRIFFNLQTGKLTISK